MPYPVLLEPTWRPENTTFCWLAIETSHPDPDVGTIIEIGGCWTGHDFIPFGWDRWIVRPPHRGWYSVLSPERRIVYETNGLIDQIGRVPAPTGTEQSGLYMKDVAKEIDRWMDHWTNGMSVPIIAGPHAPLTHRWLDRFISRFAGTVHPITFDTFGITHQMLHGQNHPDPAPGEPDGRVIPTVFRSVSLIRELVGRGPLDYKAEYPVRYQTALYR